MVKKSYYNHNICSNNSWICRYFLWLCKIQILTSSASSLSTTTLILSACWEYVNADLCEGKRSLVRWTWETSIRLFSWHHTSFNPETYCRWSTSFNLISSKEMSWGPSGIATDITWVFSLLLFTGDSFPEPFTSTLLTESVCIAVSSALCSSSPRRLCFSKFSFVFLSSACKASIKLSFSWISEC